MMKNPPITIAAKRRADGTMPGQRFTPEVRAEMRRAVLECPHPVRTPERRKYIVEIAERFGAAPSYVLSQALEHR